MDLANLEKKIRAFREGQKRYLYDERADDGVCKAHILKVLPHPEYAGEQLVVYRWYAVHRRSWRYGVTETWKQRIWADYVKKVVKHRQEEKHKTKNAQGKDC